MSGKAYAIPPDSSGNIRLPDMRLMKAFHTSYGAVPSINFAECWVNDLRRSTHACPARPAPSSTRAGMPTPRGGQTWKWKMGDKQEYYNCINLYVKNGIMFFYISILVICDIQKPPLGNDCSATCFKQCSARSNQITIHIWFHCVPLWCFMQHMQEIHFVCWLYSLCKIKHITSCSFWSDTQL